MKLWGNSKCKGLLAAASLAGGGTDRKLVGLEWHELGEGRWEMRLETEGVGTGLEELRELGKEFRFSSKCDGTCLQRNTQFPKNTPHLT